MTENFKAYHRGWTMTYMAYVEFAIEDTTQKFDALTTLTDLSFDNRVFQGVPQIHRRRRTWRTARL
ncbi:MAG: hypothetical protein IKC74_00730 [Clostridia bacterium]|nr:hypothetical protein [Clostridia bacterium]